jgi:hypothetical protein
MFSDVTTSFVQLNATFAIEKDGYVTHSIATFTAR